MQQPLPEQINPPAVKARKTNSLQNVAALKILLNAIAFRARTQPEIMELTGLCNSTVSRWIRYLHVSTPEVRNLVYIHQWTRNGDRGNWAACWKMGYAMSDALKPKPLSSGQHSKRWREKKAREARTTVTDKGIKHVLK